MEGQTISHYRILEKIGEGGMGEVYLAEDTSLDRKVALKFLPEHLHSDDVAHKRFLREAKSAAALDHPFICHIHEVGEVNGKNFISMEYVEGGTLRDRLKREPLSYREVLRVGSEIAEALQRAHEAGIVHRDLKPSNIMLTKEGRVKVMDFGLAKRVVIQDGAEQETTQGLTKAGTTLGTVPYMSPEQLRGEEVDVRSDIFSFGILLYEMLLGEHPFQRDTPMQTAAAILETEPDFSSGSQAAPGGTLHDVLVGMLTKDRDRRCDSVKPVRETLGTLLEQITPAPTPRWLLWAAGLALASLILVGAHHLYNLVTVPSGPIDSLAVLLFATEGDHPDLETLAVGIPESIIHELSPVVHVAASTSSFQLGSDADPKKVAELLNVRTVLTGKLIARGDVFRVSVDLIDPAENRAIWGNHYDWALEELFSTQEAIAIQVVQNLKIELTEEEASRMARRPTVNMDAYRAYQEGRQVYKTLDNQMSAIGHFQAAKTADPNFAQAYTGLAYIYGQQGLWGWLPLSKVLPEIRSSAAKALELDPSLAEAHCAFGLQKVLEGDWLAAEKEFRLAVQLNPNLPDGYVFLANYYLAPMGRADEAVVQMKNALELDPLSADTNFYMGYAYQMVRSGDEAIRRYELAIKIDPGHHLTHRYLGRIYAKRKMYEEARSQFALATPKNCPVCMPPMEDPSILLALDEREQALKALENLTDGEHDWRRAATYARLGRPDQMFETLERIVEDPDPYYSWIRLYLKVHNCWNPYRDNPRFQEVARRLGFEP